jgi:hypothetical protein
VYGVQAGPLRGALRELLKGQNQNILSLRQATSDFFAAKDAGNSQAAMQAAEKAKSSRHCGTCQHLATGG